MFTSDLQGLGFEDRTQLLGVGISEVDLVADEDLGEGGVRRVPVDAVDPGTHILERLPIRQVEGYDHTVRLLVKLLRYSVEALLACGVPDLNIYFIEGRGVVRIHSGGLQWMLILSSYIVYTDGFNMRLFKFMARESKSGDYVSKITVRE